MHPTLTVSRTEGLLRSAIAGTKNTEGADLVVGSHGHAFASLAAVSVSTAEGEETAAIVGELFQAVGAFAEGFAVGAVGEAAVFVVGSITSITSITIIAIIAGITGVIIPSIVIVVVPGVVVVSRIVVASVIVVVTVTSVIIVIASVVIVVPSDSNPLTPLTAIAVTASERE